MITFFRKTRHHSISENRLIKYFFYAIGEIILVVIGILIALSINSWNSDRLENITEREYLKGLQANLEYDIKELEIHFKTDTIKLDAYTYLIRAFNADTVNFNDSLIITNTYPLLRSNWFEGNNVVFEDLKSSGRLNLISSASIRNQIQTYYRLFVEIVKREDLGNEAINFQLTQSVEYFPAASFFEPTFEDRWNGNVGPPNLDFLHDIDIPVHVNRLSVMKAYQHTNHKSRVELYLKAVSLKDEISNHLKSDI